jgi:hypothetical protein
MEGASMQIHDVNTRDIAAPVERIGSLLDGLGSADDRLWPAERWPTTPFVLEGPLAVGTRGSQGAIRQVVAGYEPGRRVAFDFAPGSGLEGGHSLELTSLPSGASRLTHTLSCRLRKRLLPLYPILIRQHRALLEDLFDRAELAATGRVAWPGRRPVSVTIANAAELAATRAWRRAHAMVPGGATQRPIGDADRAERRGLPGDEARGAPQASFGDTDRADRRRRAARFGGMAVPAVLTALAALHAAWALGWRWPGGDDRAFAERVIGHGATEAPPAAASWAVAVALLAAAGIVAAAATSGGRRMRLATLVVAGVFAARGALSIPLDLAGGVDEIYERLDLAIYSPLCLGLAAGAAAVARRPAATAARPQPAPASMWSI